MKESRYLSLTASEYAAVENAYKTGIKHHFHERCHAILLSHARYSIGDISTMLNKQYETIRGWFNRWQTGGLKGLEIQSGRGIKPKLSLSNPELVELVKKKSKNNP